MVRSYFIFVFFHCTILFSQPKLTKNSFFPLEKEFPKNYNEIISDSNGWKVVSHFNCTKNKIDSKANGIGRIEKFIPFSHNNMYLKIKGTKLIGKGDRKLTEKIKYIDENTLILEYKIGKRPKRTKIRTIYSRVTK